MARQSLLLILNPSNDNFNIPEYLIINNPLILNDNIKIFEEAIKIINSLPNETQLIINFISSEIPKLELNVTVVDGILALLLSLETFIKSFQFNWISQIDPETTQNWIEAFPFINFIKQELISNNFIQLPQVGKVHIECDYFLKSNFSSSNFKVIRKEQVKGFLSDEKIKMNPVPIIPPKLQVNLESDGILFELVSLDKSSLLFMDFTDASITFIEPVYVPYLKKFLVTVNKRDESIPQNLNNKWLDRSFSLSDWTNEDSIDEDSLKKNNKLKLKKLILLSLRGIGIKKSDKQFVDVWKHLYCGCIFSLRKELSSVEIDQTILLKTIKENIKFLNL